MPQSLGAKPQIDILQNSPNHSVPTVPVDAGHDEPAHPQVFKTFVETEVSSKKFGLGPPNDPQRGKSLFRPNLILLCL